MKNKFKKNTFLLISVIIIFTASPLYALTPKQILKLIGKNKANSEYIKGSFTAIKGKRKRTRKFVMYVKKFNKKSYKHLFTISSPSSLRGTAVLSTVDGNSKKSYLFLPSTKKLMRLNKKNSNSSSKKGVLGTDFSPSDLDMGNVSMKNVTRIKDNSVSVLYNGKKTKIPCYVLRVKTPNAKALYNIRMMYIGQSHGHLPLLIKMYKNKKPIKILKVLSIAKIGKYIRPKVTVIANIPKKSKTILKQSTYKFTTIPARIFSERSIRKMNYLD